VRKSFLILTVFTFIAALFLDGCIPSKEVQQERIISADRLIKRLEANRRKIKTYSGYGSVTIKTSDMDAKSSFQVEIKRPDSVKVSFFGPFGVDLASALITQNNFQFYDAINNTYYKGKLKSGAMKQVMKIDVSFDELLDILTGSVNMTDRLKETPTAYESQDENYNLVYNDSTISKTSQYTIRQKDLSITNFAVRDFSGKSLINAGYSDFHEAENMQVPYKIDVNEVSSNQKIKLEYRSIDVNKEIGNLNIDIPNDAKIIDW
jgi:outer membrane lipoprotein-sorting protein